MLVILSKENKHQHGGYLSLDQGQGITSPEGSDEHVHIIRLEPAEIDQFTGEVIKPEGWIVEASGNDPHTHEIEELVREEPKIKKVSDDERVQEVISLIEEADKNENDSVRMASESYDFYFGDGQWDQGAKSSLEANQRAAMTVNLAEPKVDVLCGTHDQNKIDVIFKPVEHGDTQTADIANMVYKSVMNQNQFHREEGYVFRDLTVTGRGCKNVEIDFDSNIEGDIKVRWFPYDKVRFGPHEREDQEDLEYLVKYDDFSMAKLKQLYPKKAKEIQASFDFFEGGVVENPHKNIAGLAYRLRDNVDRLTFGGDAIVDVQRKEFKVFQLWQKEFKNVEGIIYAADNFVEDGTGIKGKDLAMIKRIPGITTIKRKVSDMRMTEMAGGILLDDEILDLPENADCFHLVTAYGKKYKNKFHGKVEPIKDLQRTYNKLTSQTVDITNKMAAYGWFYDNETFENQTDAEMFKQTSSQAGFNQKVKDISRVPVQVQGVKFPNELVNLKEGARADIDMIMGVPPKANDFSGDLTTKLYMLSKRQSLVGNDFLFENANMANKRLAKLVIAYVQELYTPERIMRIIGSQTEEDIAELQDSNVINVTIEEIEDMLNNKRLLDLDLVMSEAPHTDTMKELTFMSLQEVMQTVGGDPTVLRHWIKNSPFPNKKNILEEMQASQEAAANANNDTNDSQNFAALPDDVKTSLAQQGIYSYKDLNQAREMQQQGPVNAQGVPFQEDEVFQRGKPYR